MRALITSLGMRLGAGPMSRSLSIARTSCQPNWGPQQPFRAAYRIPSSGLRNQGRPSLPDDHLQTVQRPGYPDYHGAGGRCLATAHDLFVSGVLARERGRRGVLPLLVRGRRNLNNVTFGGRLPAGFWKLLDVGARLTKLTVGGPCREDDARKAQDLSRAVRPSVSELEPDSGEDKADEDQRQREQITHCFTVASLGSGESLQQRSKSPGLAASAILALPSVGLRMFCRSTACFGEKVQREPLLLTAARELDHPKLTKKSPPRPQQSSKHRTQRRSPQDRMAARLEAEEEMSGL